MDNRYLGANIYWKKKGPVAAVLSAVIGLFFASWRQRQWKAWHTGFIVDILPDGQVITCEAVAKGISYATYDSLEDLGECYVINWLWETDEQLSDDVWKRRKDRIEDWVYEHLELPYDKWGYLWTALLGIRWKLTGKPGRYVDLPKFCWENTSEFDRFAGKEIQPPEEPVLINRMMDICITDIRRVLRSPYD